MVSADHARVGGDCRDSDEVRSAMRRGVLGAPEVTFLEEAEELSY
jgi:hypothetical protein